VTEPVLLTGRDLRLDDVAAVACGARLAADPAAVERVAAGNAAAAAVRDRREVYGQTTGVGAVREELVDAAGDHGSALLRSHAAGWGETWPQDRVRAALAIRANQLLVGRSGARPEVVRAIVDLGNAEPWDLPLVHREGNIGAGDLTALAEVGLALAGERPRASGQRVRSIELTAEDALPLLSSNAFVIADAALGALDLERSSRFADVTCALTFVALQGNPEAFSEVAVSATPFPGALATATEVRRLLSGQDVTPAHIQDFFGLRTWPQANGPLVDALASLRQVLETSFNTASENPLFTDGDRGPEVTHHGGFHAAYLALAADTTLLALARSSRAVQSRVAHLLTDRHSGLPLFLADETAASSGLLIAEYAAASAVSVIREAAAAPASTQTTSVSAGIEDDASFAGLAAARLARAAGAHRRLVATELVCAVRALRLRGIEPVGVLRPVWERCAALPASAADRDLGEDFAVAEELVSGYAAGAP
jgi:histidine ammonia-lyase